MGTRSTTIFVDGNAELARVYRQFDGYPEGMGVDLARACNKLVTSGGYTMDMKAKTHASGMGCLAAQAIAALKGDQIGNVYLEPVGGEINDWVEYVYVVRRNAASDSPNSHVLSATKPTIECSTHATGAWPFNLQKESGFVFSGTPDEWLAKYAEPEPVKKPRKARATLVQIK